VGSIGAAFLLAYVPAMVIVVLIGFFVQRAKEQLRKIPDWVIVEFVEVIVPFRNEADRIMPLLESFRSASELPGRITFVDDHSTDNSVALIHKHMEGLPYQVLSMPDDQSGKKLAIRHGIKQAGGEYILTLDADVWFEKNYFTSIGTLPRVDMLVLPAVMKAKKWFEYLFEIDVLLANAINMGISGISRPIMASGANLLFRKDVFERVDNLERHQHMASGDDTYLLRDFREKNCSVRLQSSLDVAVYTETPSTFKSFIDQRLRWISKTGDIKDPLNTSIAWGQLILSLFFLSVLFFYYFTGKWFVVLLFFLGKTGVDLGIFFPYAKRINRPIPWALLPVYQLLFPFYSILLTILVFTYKPKWKGRKIYDNKKP